MIYILPRAPYLQAITPQASDRTRVSLSRRKLPGRDKHQDTSEKLLRDVTGVSGWEPTCQRRPHDTGWIPGAGRLHGLRRNDWSLRAESPRAATREATALRPAAARDNAPRAAARESLREAASTQHSQK